MQQSKPRFDLDLDAMLAKCRRLQWSTDDVDWDAPGAEVVDDPLRARLGGFMADLHWIEGIAARVFAAMAARETDAALAAVYATFSADEQRHADAELLLMHRWGLTPRGARPPINPNAQNLHRALDRGADRVHPAIFAAIIPFTELVLDGALVKHLDETIADPVSAEVFRRINADEARHLAVDFHVLERSGGHPVRVAGAMARALVHPTILYALVLGYLPLLPRMRDNIDRLGLPPEKLDACVARYVAHGDESPRAARHPTYAFFRLVSRGILTGHDGALEVLMRISDLCHALGL